MIDAYGYCEALVRQRDRERYISSLFAPARDRAHLYALYAFDGEIARIPDAVREPMAGEIRLQWWREVLAGARKEEALANPVSAALLDMMTAREVDARKLLRLVDARQFDLLGEPMPSLDTLERYFDDAFGSTIGLAARVLYAEADAAGSVPAGRCLGILAILRNLPRDVSKGRLLLPLDILAANGVHTADVLRGEVNSGLNATIEYLLVAAEQYLAEVRQIAPHKRVLPAFLPLALVPAQIARARNTKNPFHAPMELSPLRGQFTLWRAARRGAL